MFRFKVLVPAIAGMMLLAAHAWAASTCHDVHVESTISAVDPMLPFGNYAGAAQVSLDGQPAVPAAVSLVPVELKLGDDGTYHLTGMLTFDLGQMGALTVQDNAVLSPTENPYVYRMSTRLDNLTGAGMFTGAFGKFSDHGQYSLATETLSAEADGRICW